jgi:Ran GTPase-activating protein (RanGAP) involved in mRNA processing and transport
LHALLVTANYTAKLIDYGLATFLREDGEAVPKSLAENFSRTMCIVGAEDYRCPEYSKLGRTKKYAPAFDVYSFGVVMLELITGSHHKQGRLGDLVICVQNSNFSEVVDDFVKQEEWDSVMPDLVDLAIDCTKPLSVERPVAAEILGRLRSIKSYMTAGDELQEAAVGAKRKSRCCRSGCISKEQVGVTCTEGHFVCQVCLRNALSQPENTSYTVTRCLIKGCGSSVFSAKELHAKIPKRVFDEIKSNFSQLHDHTKALASIGPHARLVWIVPGDGGDVTGKNWVNLALRGSLRLFLLCQHSFACLEPSLDVSWEMLVSLIQTMKHSAGILAAVAQADMLAGELPFLPGNFKNASKVEAYSRCVNDFEALASLLSSAWNGAGFEEYFRCEANSKLVAVANKNGVRIFVEHGHAKQYSAPVMWLETEEKAKRITKEPAIAMGCYIHDEAELDLSCKQIGVVPPYQMPMGHVQQIALELALNTTLKRLDLSWNNFGDDGAVAIAKALRINKSLEILCLAGNKIGNKGTEAITSCLQMNKSLRELHLGADMTTVEQTLPPSKRMSNDDSLTNELGIGALVSLANALKVNTKLATLGLGSCSIDDLGVAILANALKSNTALTTLSLRSNSIGGPGAHAILDVLNKYNTTLTYLDLNDNGEIPLFVHSAFEHILAANAMGNRSVDKGIESTTKSFQENILTWLEPEETAKQVIKDPITATGRYIHDKAELDLRCKSIGAVPPYQMPKEQVQQIADELALNTTLKCLDLSWNNFGDDGAVAIAKALRINKSLEILNLACNKIGNKGTEAIAGALLVNRSLRCLDLSGHHIGVDGAVAIASSLQTNKSLEILHLNGNKIGSTGAAAIADALKMNKSLRELHLKYAKLGDDGIVAIAQMLRLNDTLRTLGLRGNEISTEALTWLADALEINTKLATLALGSCSVNDEGAGILAGALNFNAALTTLSLPSNSISTVGARAILEVLKKEKSLLTDLDLIDNGEISLFVHSKLERILAANAWRGRSVPAAAAEQIALEYIHDEAELDLRSKEINAGQAQQLAKELATNTTLKRLYLDSNGIGDEGAACITDALRINKSLLHLSLDSNQIGYKGAAEIAKALQRSKSLEALYLNSNEIGNQGSVLIADALQVNKSLRCVALAGNKIGNVGITMIAECLKQNNSLQELILCRNTIGRAALLMLADGLAVNTGLATLGLSSCSINDEGAAVLANALKSNRRLSKLFLGGNRIGDSGASEMLDVLSGYDTALTILDLNDNSRMSDTICSAIKDIVAANAAGAR